MFNSAIEVGRNFKGKGDQEIAGACKDFKVRLVRTSRVLAGKAGTWNRRVGVGK